MATIDFLDGIDPITGSRRGVTFDVSQAGPTAKKRPAPVNTQTNRRLELRSIMHATNQYYWNLTPAQKAAWSAWGAANGITGPYGCAGVQRGCAAYFKLLIRARMAGDPFYNNPPNGIPVAGVTITNLIRIDENTIRTTFNPSPAGANNRVGMMQTIPRAAAAGSFCEFPWCDGFTGLNGTSPHDFTPYFTHRAGLQVIYRIGTQDVWGRRSTLDEYVL